MRDASALAEHQIEAVERIEDILRRCGGALLADEPGLGKSFVAAEVARREMGRGAVVEFVVPASLVAQWNATLRSFGVEARITTPDRLITDAYVAQPRARLVVVDEAHSFRNPDTQRYAALARRSAGARLLLVTATPVCNSARDLESLLRLIVADDAVRDVASVDTAFERRDRDAIRAVMDELVVRRGADVLPARLRFGDLRRRVARFELPPRPIDELRFPLITDGALVRQFLWRRYESSEAALLESVRRQRRFYERALECLAAGRALPKREYRQAFGHEEDAAAFQTVLFWELFVPPGETTDAQALHAEIARLDALHRAAEAQQSQKLAILLEIVENDPVLVFTGWAATAIHLHAAIAPRKRTALVTGRARARIDEAVDAFRRGRVDVLISTDVGAEGLNLQRAGLVIHYDVPWNPVKLDQRNGRAHRIGQERNEVEAIYFLTKEDPADVMRKVAAKTRTRNALLSASGGNATPPPNPAAARPRPRLPPGAAAVAFARAVEAAGWRLPLSFARRHKAAFEVLLTEIAAERIDERKLSELAGLAALEPWGRSPEVRFRNL